MDIPEARAGMRIGLLGGSFDPPHEGHMLITRQALRAFRLDRVWWLASPGIRSRRMALPPWRGGLRPAMPLLTIQKLK